MEVETTNDKQVEAWKAEFESLKNQMGESIAYRERDYEFVLLVGFMAAKRSMPPIDLPSGHGMTISYREGISDAIDAITAAGYSYKVNTQA